MSFQRAVTGIGAAISRKAKPIWSLDNTTHAGMGHPIKRW